MNRIRFAVILPVLCLGVFSPPALAKSGPCEGRERCAVVKTHEAGTDSQGHKILLIETFVTNPPDAEEYAQCGRTLGKPGGQEYWRALQSPDGKIVVDSQPLLSLCNDGYGAAGVGQDKVTISSNRLTHIQSGGSSDRWEREETYSLSPFHIMAWRECGWNVNRGGGGTVIGSAAPLLVRSWAKPLQDINDDRPLPPSMQGCPDGKNMEEAEAIQIPVAPIYGKIPDNALLGNCSTEVNSDVGFQVLGTPGKSIFRIISSDTGDLFLQVYDPDPLTVPAKSWIYEDHVEMWGYDPQAEGKESLWQIGITLKDGKVYKGYGKPPMPQVYRGEGKDEQGRHVTLLHLKWLDMRALTGREGGGQTSIAYVESSDGKTQERMTATSRLKYADSTTFGITSNMPFACSVKNNGLEIMTYDVPNLSITPLP